MPDRRTALVTGANGFVGTTLVKRLRLQGVTVRALVRSETGAHSLRATGCEIWKGDITAPVTLAAATRGVDVVYHCAWGGNSVADTRAAIVEGTRHVATAAVEAGVRRLVHVSSFAVHGTRCQGEIIESTAIDAGNPYAAAKAEAEDLVLAMAARTDLEAVIIRPTLVYGPGSRNWIIDPLSRVRQERISLIANGQGLANLVYVDDLVEALVLAAETPGISGETFLLSGAEPITWREYLGYFSRMCDKPLPPSLSLFRARIAVFRSKWFSRLTGRPRLVDQRDVTMMTQAGAVDISKACRLMGYSPRVTPTEGMRRTEAWLRQHGYLPPAIRAEWPAA